MIRAAFLMILLFVPSLLWAGVELKGVVIDPSGGRVIYCSIGLTTRNVGTVSDTKGEFSLVIDEQYIATDTISFICLGYQTRYYAVKDLNFSNDQRIVLNVAPLRLDDIVVNFRKGKEKTIANGFPISSPEVKVMMDRKIYPNDLLGRELCFFLKKERGNYLLKDIGIFISFNNFSFLRFRVNIYAIKNGLPSDKIAEGVEYLDVKGGRLGYSKCIVDRFIDQDVYVGIEIIEVKDIAGLPRDLAFKVARTKDIYFYRASNNASYIDFRDAIHNYKSLSRADKNSKVSYRGTIIYYKDER